MKRKSILLLTISGVLLVGSVTGLAYANAKNGDADALSKLNMERKLWTTSNSNGKEQDKAQYEDMLKLMRENGWEGMAKAMTDKDYAAMDQFMNNLTDEDYQKMIKMMRGNGYESMANMMESMDKDSMIQMHNAMGGAKSCHRTGSGMMENL
ncbi:hypothetical protein [Thermotalea metallivorans]|uniref:DUF2680 domain-containing protein n=1 Tax=Thermotalea metallivorans TaxID=520762 RepID=A0A140KZN1_9FIRM|nr:hypothetical protein [Thermotalea metallivorans]KXG73756.1 hypothetical protein AN619_29210 [Thermotalea metallivorans]